MHTVLVVDDEADIRELVRLNLELAGHHVIVAVNGVEALEFAVGEHPDCMVLDVMMPRIDGFAVLRSMRSRELAPETRVIVLTCRTEERDFARGWELGLSLIHI